MIIYLLCTNFSGELHYKIGHTKNLAKRIKQLSTGNIDISVIYSFESKWATKIESAMHRKYDIYRIGGEWFKLKPEHIETFLHDCQSIHDSLDYLSKNNTYVIDKNIL